MTELKSTDKPEEKELVMEFDTNTIQHLGFKMYSTLPPVIAEIIANSYDADAKEVKIYLNDTNELQIIIKDNGHGMAYTEINSKFLKIGRNRREDEGRTESPEKRPLIGKKGIGKLSFFGISNLITVETINGYQLNEFSMSLDDVLKEKEVYKPKILRKNEKTVIEHGTAVKLNDLKRKSKFVPSAIARSLARTFSVFDEKDFVVKIIYNNAEIIKLTNDMKYQDIPIEFQWQLPITDKEIIAKVSQYSYSQDISGRIISSEHTVPADMKGVALFSNGKLVNDHEFYGNKATSHGYEYITGDLDVSFIDKWKEDVISTNRRSLNWEDEETGKLGLYLKEVITVLYNKQRELRGEKKKKRIETIVGADIDEWITKLPKHEQKLAKSMINIIINSEELNDEKASDLIGFVQDSFKFESFKEFAAQLDDIVEISNEDLLQLLKDWKLIEANEFYRLSIVRVKTITQFEEYVSQNAKEVPTLHEFLKQFPWLLDPRIMEFQDEVYYSKLLEEKYPDSDEELESDRRIDFVCMTIANSFFIIELKRPWHKLRKKDIEQAIDYRTFVEKLQGSETTSANSVVAYIICGKQNEDRIVADMTEAYKTRQLIFVRTYSELLHNAKNYHQEFIDKYNEMQKTSKELN
ncbi:ATP-binding protein [Chloroflexota bacterium]